MNIEDKEYFKHLFTEQDIETLFPKDSFSYVKQEVVSKNLDERTKEFIIEYISRHCQDELITNIDEIEDMTSGCLVANNRIEQLNFLLRRK